jgi:hypothetical protein
MGAYLVLAPNRGRQETAKPRSSQGQWRQLGHEKLSVEHTWRLHSPLLGLTDVAEKDCVRSDAHLECRTLLTSPKRT